MCRSVLPQFNNDCPGITKRLRENLKAGQGGTLNKLRGHGEQGYKKISKTFADSVSCLFRELPECTAGAEAEWRLFKAAVASSAAWVRWWDRLGVSNCGKNNPVVEPSGERCFMIEESSLQGFAFAVRWGAKVRRRHDVKVQNAILGEFGLKPDANY